MVAFGCAAAVALLSFITGADARRHHYARAYAPARAAIIVDGHTGKILHSSAADEARYPASLTKVMTLYLTFEAMRAGRITPATELNVSAHAASQDPTKLDLEPGDKITVRDAIRGLVTKSANDAAVVLAEHIGGSEEAFAKLMTAKARQIGMLNTTFRNANGLPNSEQRSTAYDLSVLARRILKDFPAEATVFQTRYFNYKGNVYRNHNSLLFNYVGAEGMKTGFTQASGFNVIATARRDKKFLIGVVMGGRSARLRDDTMRGLLNASWARAGLKPAKPVEMAAVVQVPPPPKPAPAPVIDAKPAVAPVKAAVKPAPAPAPAAVKPAQVMLASAAPSFKSQPPEPVAPATPASLAPAKSAEIPPPPQPAAAPAIPAAVESVPGVKGPQLRFAAVTPAVVSEPAAPDSKPEAQPVSVTASAVSVAAPVEMSGKRFQVQVGAYATEESAQQRLAAVLKDAGDILGSHPQLVVAGKSGKNHVIRVRFDGFSEKSASTTCEQLKKRAIDCMAGRFD